MVYQGTCTETEKQIYWESCKGCKLYHQYYLTLLSFWDSPLLLDRGVLLIADALMFCEFVSDNRQPCWCLSGMLWWAATPSSGQCIRLFWTLKSLQLGTSMPFWFISGPWSDRCKKQKHSFLLQGHSKHVRKHLENFQVKMVCSFVD